MKKIYMIHQDKRAMLHTNKRQSIRIARKHKAEVREMDYGLYTDCRAWDYPTFYVQSNRVNF